MTSSWNVSQIDLGIIVSEDLKWDQARIQDFLTGGLTAGGVPPFSLPFPLFPPLPFTPLPPPLPFPLPPSLPSLRSRPP